MTGRHPPGHGQEGLLAGVVDRRLYGIEHIDALSAKFFLNELFERHIVVIVNS